MVNLDPALACEANADATRVRQVLTNLLGNALKFTPSGCVRVEALVTGTGHLRIEVEDRGVGVSPETANRLFEAFYQGDSGTSRQFKGTGLGLAISREIVHALHGEIGYFANPIVGSTFWFEIPFERLASCVEQPSPAPQLPAARARDAGVVLLSEDDPVNRRVLTVMLDKLGYETVVVEDGHAAVAVAEERPFCVILMDCMMPGIALARTALHGGDAAALAALAHDVAGSSGALHVRTVAECAFKLEHGARGGVALEVLAPLVDEMERRFTRWRDAQAA